MNWFRKKAIPVIINDRGINQYTSNRFLSFEIASA